ncbi:Sulfotransferase domain [Mactra antiquata]
MEWKTVELRDKHGEGFDIIKCEDIILPSFVTDIDKKLQMMKDLKHKDEHILLCSYPKTGTHWVSNIVEFICSEKSVEETSTVMPKLMELMPMEVWSAINECNILSSHFTANHIPDQFFQKGSKTIVIVRNPKDAMVSMFHHLQKAVQINTKMSWDYFYEIYSTGEVPYGSYFDYYDSYEAKMEECDSGDFLIVSFENLKKNCLEELKRIQEFIGTKKSEDELQKIIERLTVKNMRQDINAGKTKSVIVDTSGQSVLYRKGEIGDWKNHFTVAQNERFDKLIEERFKNSVFNIDTN